MAITPNKGWNLNKRDLDAIRAAATVACENPDRAAINTLSLKDGYMASTDTHRLFVYSADWLRDVPLSLLSASLGRELRDTYADAHKGTLFINDDEALLRLAGGWEIRAPLVRETFPDWRVVMPGEPTIKVVARCGDWLQALELLKKEHDAAECEAPPRVLVVITPAENKITLRQGHELSPKAGKLASEVSVWFPAEFPVGDTDMILAMSPTYLREAISCLGLSDDAQVEVCATDPHCAVLTQAAGGGDTFFVTMPMHRIATPKPEQEPAAAT